MTLFASLLPLGVGLLVACSAGGTSDLDASTSSGGSSGDPPSDRDASIRADTRSSEPPALTKLAYTAAAGGTRILVAGTDPGDWLESVWLDFLDESGAPASIDPEEDGTTEPNQLEIPVAAMERSGGSFFFEIRGGPSLERFVHSVTATPQDRKGARGAPLTATSAPLASRRAGETCDPRGFDVCAPGLVCTGEATPACEELGAARAKACASAPLVAIGSTTSGTVGGASLWDPIDGCASAERRGRPEATLRLHVPTRTPSLSIATVASGTTFDSVVSLLDDCGAAPKTLACNDDDPPPSSRITLTDLAAGDYVVVVDSLDLGGGTFELRVSAP